MPFNGSGSFTPPGSDFPAVPATLIESSKFNAVINDIATGLSTCITKDGQTTVTANIPMGGFRFTGLGAGSAAGNSLRYEQLFTTSAVTLLGAMNWVTGANIASAATINLTTATGNAVHVTGTTTITAVTLGSGMWRLVIFDGALTLTHHATNNNLPGNANITTAANDRALYYSDGTTVYCAIYQKASGLPVGNTAPGFGAALSNNVSDATNDIDIAAGARWDSTYVSRATIAAMTKRLDANWSPGTGNGMRYSGAAIANTTYHIFAVWKADGTQDIYAYPGATVATVLSALQAESGGADYVYLCRLGAIIRESAAIVPFVQNGVEFQRSTPILELSATIGSSSAITTTLSVPTGIKCVAIFNAQANGDGAGNVGSTYFSDLATTDVAASNSVAPLTSVGDTQTSAAGGTAQVRVRTNTSAQIRRRSIASSGSATLYIATLGWVDDSLGGF